MRIISFADFRANADPFYKMHKVLKLSDFITLLVIDLAETRKEFENNIVSC